MRYLFTLLLFVAAYAGSAQKSQPVHHVRLFSGEMIDGDRLLYLTPILKQPMFELDGKKYESFTVAYFQNNHGYFGNLSKIHGDKAERYALRIKKGKINLFEEIDLTYYGGDILEVGEGSEKPEELATGELFQYYAMSDDSPLKKATYKSLRADIGSNEAALKHLKAHRNFKWLQGFLIAAGAGIIAYDIVQQSDDAVRFSPMMAVGIVVGGSSYFLENKKADALWLAADAYNKE